MGEGTSRSSSSSSHADLSRPRRQLPRSTPLLRRRLQRGDLRHLLLRSGLQAQRRRDGLPKSRADRSPPESTLEAFACFSSYSLDGRRWGGSFRALFVRARGDAQELYLSYPTL
mgnify:CR=1 FL=1